MNLEKIHSFLMRVDSTRSALGYLSGLKQNMENIVHFARQKEKSSLNNNLAAFIRTINMFNAHIRQLDHLARAAAA